MKFLIALSVLAFSTFASAETVESCKLSSMNPDEYSVSGNMSVEKSGQKLNLVADSKMSGDEGQNKVQMNDEVEGVDVATGKQLEDLLESDNVAIELARRLGDEKPVSLTTYAGKNFSMDGAGLMLFRMKGEKNTVLGVAMIGWNPAYCD